MALVETVRYISVRVDPKSIPEPFLCLLCGGPTHSAWLEYELRDGPVVVKNTELVPGYRCEECGAEYYDTDTVGLELDKATLKELKPNSKVRAALKERIAIHKVLALKQGSR